MGSIDYVKHGNIKRSLDQADIRNFQRTDLTMVKHFKNSLCLNVAIVKTRQIKTG